MSTLMIQETFYSLPLAHVLHLFDSYLDLCLWDALHGLQTPRRFLFPPVYFVLKP